MTKVSPKQNRARGAHPPMLERFLSKFEVNPDTMCWEWTATLSQSGYPQIGLEGRKTGYAHRLSHELFNGTIPSGYQVDHLCFVKKCVNPDHLEAVTQQENCRRSALRFRWETCKNGHAMDSGSLYVNPRGLRECGICKRVRDSKYHKARIRPKVVRTDKQRQVDAAYRERNRERLREYRKTWEASR